MGEKEGSPITQGEVEGFADRLQSWGTGLPAREQALLQLMLAKCQHTELAEVQGYIAGTSIRDAATAALKAISEDFMIAPLGSVVRR